jgi:hypothetical protein
MMDVPKTSRVVALSDGGETTLASELPAPTGLAVERGALYVSDRSLGQILMIASDGKGLPEPRVVAADLTTPEDFVVTERGLVVVEADAGRVTEIDAAGQRRTLAEIPPGRSRRRKHYPHKIYLVPSQKYSIRNSF